MIRPQVVLTAAHCLEGMLRARVTHDSQLAPTSYWINSYDYHNHPDYVGNRPGESVDIGLIFLDRPSLNLTFPRRISYSLGVMCERIGYGMRGGSNARTWQNSYPENLLGTALRLKDEFGVVGDSGGPVYQRRNGELVLIGVHTGRQVLADGTMLDVSYVQLLTDEIWQWVLNTIELYQP
jgi:V8-like Glu-specific endopeptidase